MSSNKSSKKKKKGGPSLLLEPSVEEEQQSVEKQQAATSSGKCSIASIHAKNSRIILESQEETTGNRQMFASKVTKNVISSSGSATGRSSSKQNAKQLTNLLAFLFGSLMIIVLASKCKSSAIGANTTRNSIESNPIVVTTTASSLFNSLINSSSLDSSITSTDLPSTLSSSTVAEELNETSSTSEPENSNESSTEKISSSPLPAQENPITTTTTSASIAEEGEEDDSEVLDEPASGSSGGRLTSGLIVDAAGEAADQILANLRPQPAADSSDGEEDSPEAAASEQVSPVERRDIGSSPMKVAESTASPEGETVTTTMHPELKIAMETWAKWRTTGDDIIELFSRKMLPVIVENGYDVDAVTVTGLLQVFNGIRAIKPWALKLLDASAKLTPGILVGTQSDFGDYDECLNVRVDDPSGLQATGDGVPVELDEVTGLPTSTLVGRYCLADIEFPKPPRVKLATRNEELNTDFAPIELRRPLLNFSETAAYKDTIFVETGNFFHMLYVDPLRVGVCLTNKIDPDSFAKVVNKLLEEFKVSINFHGRCVTKYDKIIWTTQQKVSACVILIACSLVSLCTFLDVLHSKLNKFPLPNRFSKGKLRFQNSMQSYRPLFTSFSIIRNTKRLFRPQVQKHKLSELQQQQQQKESNNSGIRHSSSNGSNMHLISGDSSNSSMISSNSPQMSLKTNQNQLGLFSAKNTQEMEQNIHRETNLLCLHGIRVLTMTWMIVNHTYLFGGFFVLWAYRRLIDIAEWPKSFSFQLVLNGWLTVETYFFLGATIIVLSVMPAMKANKFTYITYILHRLIRLLPAYTGLICLNFLWPLVSSGPVWLVKGKSFIQTPCENYLWTNYLFINNWIWPEKQCMVHTWFLSADFQLYLLAPLIVYLLYRRPIFGHSVNIIVAIIASIISGFVIYANKLMPTTLINKLEFDSIKQQLSYSYFATYQHVGPYCLGIFTGYLLYKRPNVQLPKHLTWALWILLPPLSFTTLFLTYLWNGAYDEPSLINPSPIVSALYVAIHRTIWTSLVAWIVFASATGRAKLLSSFLSHPMFIPLSRLSFSIYLVHLPVIMYRALNLRHTIEWTDSNILWEACGNFIVSIIVGYFVNVTFESPITNLEQVIFRRGNHNSSANRDRFKIQNPKLRPQLTASKTSSENDSDDSKSAKSSELAAIKTCSLGSQETRLPHSDSSGIGCSETASQLLDRHMRQWPVDSPIVKSKSMRQKQKQQVLTSVDHILARRQLESTAIPPNYCDVAYDVDDDDDGDIDDLMTSDSGSPVINSPKELLRQVAPAVMPVRRYSAFESPSSKLDRSSSIYQMAPSEYQRYASRHTPLLRSELVGGLLRSPQYATMARSNRFQRNDIRASESRHDYERPSYVAPTQARSHLGGRGGSISRSSQRGATLLRGGMEIETSAGIRRQGRYNTLTGTGSREWRQHLGSNQDDKWLMGTSSRVQDELSPVTGTNWLVQAGAMIPRIDSSTLRGTPLVRTDTTRTSSIVEEEREDMIR